MVVLQHDETIKFGFVQFWDGVYGIFFCANSGRRFNSFIQWKLQLFTGGS